MAESVNIGTLSGVLAMRDEFSAQMAKFETRLKAIEASTVKTTRTTKTETDKINDAYRKVAASLDPVVARTQKYESTIKTLDAALKKGIITQKEYNEQVARAKTRLETTTHWTDRLGSSIGANFVNQFAMLRKELKEGVINLEQYNRKLSELKKALAIGVAIAAAAAALGLIVSLTKQIVKANVEAEESERKVIESIRRYGDVSGVTVKQVDDLAQSISRLTGIDDELLANAEVMSLKFNRISTEIFPRFTRAAVDMAVATGQDLSSAFEKAGKIVNQPLRALTLLAREGYAVGASQAALIKSLLAAGEIEKAQIEIIKILEKQYGGAAVAARDAMGGALKALGTTWENFLEKVGQDNMGPLRQALEAIISLLEIATDRVDDFTIGFHTVRVAVNLFARDAINNMADLIDIISKAAPLFGIVGIAIGQVNKAVDLSARARAAAAAADKNAADSQNAILKALLGVSSGHKKAAGSALEQTEAEAKLGAEIRKVRSDLDATIASLIRSMTNKMALFAAAVQGSKAYREELLRQKIAEKILAEENKLRAVGLKLTESQKYAISTAIREEARYDDAIKRTIDLQRIAIEQTDRLAKAGFAESFRREMDKIRENVRLVQIDVEKMLDALSLKRDLSNEVEFQVRIAGIEEIEPRLRKLEEDYISFLRDAGRGSVAEGERVFALLGDAGRKALEQIRNDLSLLADIDIAAQLKADIISPDTSLKHLRETLERLKKTTDATGKSLLSAAEAQEIYARAVSEFAADLLQSAGDFISQLGQITKSANVQKWGNFISQAGNAANAANQFYSNPSVVGMFGAAGAWLSAFVTIAEMFTTKKGLHFGAEIGDVGGSAGVVDQWTFVKGQIDEARKAGNAVADVINEVVSALGAQLDNLANFFIEQKGEGWAVTFAGGMRRYFDDFEDAVAFGVSQALAMSDLSNISEEMRKALQENVFDTIDELREFISFAHDYTRLGLSDLTTSLMDLTARMIEGARKAVEYGLEIGKITDEFGRQVSAVRDRILGIVRSPREQLRANVVDFNKWIEEQRLAAQIQIDSARAQMIAAKLQMDAAFANIKASGKDKDPEMVALFAEAQRIWKDAANRLDLWTKALENLPPLITPEEEEEAAKRLKGKGGGGGGRQDARDFVKERTFELDLRGMSEWQRTLAELDKQYDVLIAQAGKDKKLKQDLLDLKERELELLKKEMALSTVDKFREFLGLITPFEDVRETAADLIAQIKESPFGDARKAKMIERVLQDIDRQLQRMSDEMAAGLLGDLAGMLDDGVLKTELLRAQFILNWQLQLADAKARMALLIAENRLSEANRKLIEDAIGTLEGLDPNEMFKGPGGGPVDEAAANAEAWYTAQAEAAAKIVDDLKRASDLLAKYTDEGIDPLTKRLSEIMADFTEIRRVMGDTPLVMSTFNVAVKRATDEFLEGVRDFREGMKLGDLSTLTGTEQFYEAQSQFRSIAEQIRAGDLSQMDKLLDLAQQYGELGQAFTGGEGLKFIMKEIDDVLGGIEGSVTDYASKLTGVSLGSPSNPMSMQSPEVVSAINGTTGAINTGNVLLLTELRESKAEQQAQTILLQQMKSSSGQFGKVA